MGKSVQLQCNVTLHVPMSRRTVGSLRSWQKFDPMIVACVLPQSVVKATKMKELMMVISENVLSTQPLASNL